MTELSPEESFKRFIKLLFSDEFLKRLKQDKMLNDAVYEELMVKDRTKWQTYVNQSTAIKDHDTRNLIHKIHQPTLIIHGTDDKEVPFSHAEFLHEKIPNSKFVPLEGFGHGSLLIEDFERVNNIIWKFIQEHFD
jgi:pimeloyl-ACP methyl ester carboxylesterase